MTYQVNRFLDVRFLLELVVLSFLEGGRARTLGTRLDLTTVEPRFNEVAGDRPLFVKWRVRYIENLDITNLRGNDQNVRYIEVIVND